MNSSIMIEGGTESLLERLEVAKELMPAHGPRAKDGVLEKTLLKRCYKSVDSPCRSLISM